MEKQQKQQKDLLQESKKLSAKQKEIDNLIRIIERLRKYHMNDVIPSKMRRAYLTKMMKLAPKHPKLKEYLPFNGQKYRQTSKSKVASNLVALKNTKQDISVRLMAKYYNLLKRFRKKDFENKPKKENKKNKTENKEVLNKEYIQSIMKVLYE